MVKNDNNTGRNYIYWAEVQLGGKGFSSRVLALVISTPGWGRGGRARHSGNLGTWKVEAGVTSLGYRLSLSQKQHYCKQVTTSY